MRLGITQLWMSLAKFVQSAMPASTLLPEFVSRFAGENVPPRWHVRLVLDHGAFRIELHWESRSSSEKQLRKISQVADSSQFDASDEPAVLRGLSPSQQERLTELLDEYLRRMESGSIPDRSELLAANPDLSEALDEYLSKLQDLNRLVVGDSPSSDIIGKQLGDFRLLRELGEVGWELSILRSKSHWIAKSQ